MKLPLEVQLSKNKKFILNLNNYRNAHYFTLNNAKKAFKELLDLNIPPLRPPIQITYTLYPKTKRKCDIANICSIVDKFFCDALVEAEKLEDDNYDYLKRVIYQFGKVDKENPRVEVEILEI